MVVYSTAVMWEIIFLLLVKYITLTCASGTNIGGDIVVDTNLTLNGTPYVVTQDLIVAENATLIIQPGVQLHFDVAVSLKVNGSLVANGNPFERIVFTLNPTNNSVNSFSNRPLNLPSNEGIRLRGGSSHQDGRLEIFVNGQWGTACDDGWDIKDTQVACRQLGFKEAKRFYTFGWGDGPIWLDDVDCHGYEISLLHCRHRGIGSHNCGHYEDVGIECQTYALEWSAKYPLWNGVEFIGSKKLRVIKYVDISQAHKAISGNGFLPHLDHVTVKRSLYGVVTINGSYPLTISNSSIKDNLFAAIYLESHSGNVTIENTVMENTTFGFGFQYSGIAYDSVDACSFQDCCSLVVLNCSFSNNRVNGISLKDFVGRVHIFKTIFSKNGMGGMTVERTYGKITVIGSYFVNNNFSGLRFSDSSFLPCNGYNGSNIQRMAFKGKISDSEFIANGYNGLVFSNGAGEVVIQNITAILNNQSGVKAYDGRISTEFKFCEFSRNQEDGCYIANQAGSHQFYNCSANSNSRFGISVSDPSYYSSPSYYFKEFILKNSTIQNNALFGIKLAFERKIRNEYEANSTMVINRNSIVGNKGGGIVLSPNSHRWYWWWHWWWHWRWYWNYPRTISFVVKNNLFEQNKVNSIYVNCFGFLGSNSSVESNTFLNNSDGVVTFFPNNYCEPDRKGNPVIVTIDRNEFTKNRAENVIYIDFKLYPETRSASIRNNTFNDNEPPAKELFPNFFRRLTSRAVIVLKEGNFTVQDNIFENPDYTFQISSLLRDHHRIVDAEMNWWGTADGCKIIDRVFDFQHNSQLSQFQFIPYYTSLNKSVVSTPRPYCFLRGSSIGGSLDSLMTLSNADSPYDVRQDVVILTNGTLVIPKNVTLRFPPRSVMVIRGTLIVNGTENEKVRFSRKPYQEVFRLAGGAGPWEGRVEFLVNNTWSAVCVSYDKSFISESKIICQQLNLYYQTYWLHTPAGQGTGFVHNVICDENIDNDIMNCSANTWSHRRTCTGYTVHVTCQQYNWAGLHLAMTNHQSRLRYLEILDAGFAYRSDIQIFGAALTIDLNHHNITNVVINNSLGTGIQVVYQSLIHYTSLMPQSTISYTKSHGVLSYSPSLILTDINMTRNDGNGLIFKSATRSWDIIHTFTAEMASRDIKKTLYLCSHNKTFVSAEKVFYYSLETMEDSLQFRCQHVVDTEPGYIIVIQELYTSPRLNDYDMFLHVYNGTNMSLGTPFKIGRTSVENRHVFTSGNSSILFDFFKRSSISEVINFLVYTVKESQTFMYFGREIRIARAKVANSLQSGILIEVIFSQNVTVLDCVVNGSLYHGIYISAHYAHYWSAHSIVRISNSSITANRQRGLYIQDYSRGNDLNILLTGNLISSNIRGGVLYYTSNRYINITSLEIKFNRFLRNEGSTVETGSHGYCSNQVMTIVDNSFEENLGFSVILTTHFCGATLLIYRNLFLSNRIPDNAVIVIGRYTSQGTVDIRNNIFTLNSERCLLLEGTVSNTQLTVTNNLFRENYCKDKSVIAILQVDGYTTIEMNIFTKNRGNSVALLQVIYDIHSSIDRRIVAFKNNTLYDNFPYFEMQYVNASDSCAFVLTGMLWPNETEFHFNRFNNTQYLMELCVRVFATSEHDVVNVTYNWWGTENGSEVQKRISDSDDNYDFAVAIIWPILMFNSDNLISLQKHDLAHKSNILSGRLFESLTLKSSQSPYFVASDLLVMENVTLTIEAGVTVKVSPRKSILVAGTLHALGTLAKPVIFTVKEPTEDNNKSQFPVRLVDGEFPWKGRAEVFYDNLWKPISVSNILVIRNIASLLCRQLGYGPSVAAEGKSDDIGQDEKESWMVEVGCYGNETALQECSLYLIAPNKTTTLPVVKCEGVPWGNVRFVPPRDENTSDLQSLLSHVQFSHCGNRHGAAVPAIEIVNSAPKLQFVTIKNCTSGGLRIFSPRTDIHLSHSTFINTRGTGISFVKTHQSVLLDSLESSKNLLGVSFEQSNGENIPRVYYGRVFVCSVEKTISIEKLTYLYFDTLKVEDASMSITCQKVLTVSKGQGIKVTLLHTTGTRRVRIYDSGNFGNLIVDRSYGSLNALVEKDLFILRDTILLQWIGDTNSEIVIQVEDINVVDSPCTYDVGFCGWRTFNNTILGESNINKTWEIQAGWPFYIDDFSYLHYNGKVLLAGSHYYWDQTGGLAAMISPPITKQSQLCSFVYFYRLSNGDVALSVYIQTGTSPKIDHRLIWRSNDNYVGYWRKVVIDLPSDIDEYRLLLVARYNSSFYYYSRNYVAVDNLLLSGCSVKEHRISNSIFSGNQHHAINYASATDSSENPPYLTIERCKVTDGYFSNLNPNTSISLDIHDTTFAITNNFIFENRFGGVTVQSGQSEGRSSSRSLVFGNTFSSNENGRILELRKEGNTENYSFILIKDNTFESNSGYGIGIVRVSDVAGEIVNNFFYNNSGLYMIDYEFYSAWQKGQEGRCELNTFYHNHGYITVNSNGPMVYRRNIFENPSSMYEFRPTYWPVTDPIDAAQNWWGSGNESSVSLRIYDKNDSNRLAAVEYRPVQKSPPSNLLTDDCPLGWIKKGHTCYAYRGGSRTLQEAKNYCKVYGGHVTSTHLLEDMELINLVMETTRPDGKPNVPVWITTEGNEDWDDLYCTVVTPDGLQKVVSCDSLYPFVCTRAVLQCFSCIPNKTMVPPSICDKPTDYAVVNCHNSTSCLITTLTTSTNQPMHIMTCGEVIAPNSSALNCSEMEKYACENVMSTMLNSSEVNSVSCRSVCCEENKCNVKDVGATDPPATTFTQTTEAPAIKCFSCTPNTTMVPPFLCDDPTNYTVELCDKSTSCLTTTLTTSANEPIYMMACGEAIAPNSTALNCSGMEKYACENVMSTMLNGSEVNSASCRSVCCEENKCNVKDLGATDPPATTFTPTTEAPDPDQQTICEGLNRGVVSKLYLKKAGLASRNIVLRLIIYLSTWYRSCLYIYISYSLFWADQIIADPTYKSRIIVHGCLLNISQLSKLKLITREISFPFYQRLQLREMFRCALNDGSIYIFVA